MKYRDGKDIGIGDKIRLWPECDGVVVCSIDLDEYTSGYKKEDWEHLKKGVLILSNKAGLIYYDKIDEDFEKLN